MLQIYTAVRFYKWSHINTRANYLVFRQRRGDKSSGLKKKNHFLTMKCNGLLGREREGIAGKGKKVTFRYLVTRIADIKEVIVEEKINSSIHLFF